MNEWLIFILKMITLLLCVLTEDYLLWCLWVKCRRFVRRPLATPSVKPLNAEGGKNTDEKTDKQPIDENVVAQELGTRPYKPEHENAYRAEDDKYYPFSSGFGHIPSLVAVYFARILSRIRRRKQPHGNVTVEPDEFSAKG